MRKGGQRESGGRGRSKLGHAHKKFGNFFLWIVPLERNVCCVDSINLPSHKSPGLLLNCRILEGGTAKF